MSAERLRRAARIAAGLLFTLTIATSAAAQTGQVRGKVLDGEGKPIADATVTIDFKGDINRVVTTKTNKQGQYVQVGLQSGPYEVTVTKDNIKVSQKARVRVGNTTELDFNLAAGGGGTGAPSPEDLKAIEVKRKELGDKFVAAGALIEAQKYDEAIVSLNAIITETGGCAICEAKIGEALWKKGDEPGAEAAFKKAIVTDSKLAEPYAALASLYNQQKKFDAAAEMSKKATDLAGAGTAGGGNPSVIFNQGIIFWNQSKVAEAKAQFELAVKLDPNLAEAHYWLGMALVNEGNTADARKSFEKYLSLAPTGQYAEMATSILKSIK